jgi:hypothetical protein
MRAGLGGPPLAGPVLAGLLSLLLLSCGPSGSITVAVRPCALAGTSWAQVPQADLNDGVVDLFNELNQVVWSQAQISFLACCQDVPVIADPDASRGPAGSIFTPGTQPSIEMEAAAAACAGEWARKAALTTGTGFDQGPIVIFVSDTTDASGSPLSSLGVTTPPRTFPNLCVAPRSLTASDVEQQYIVSIEPAQYGFRQPRNGQGSAMQTLAHELGHTLLLSHGDGLDNNLNGVAPPSPGPRLFDKCDAAAEQFAAETGSLMSHGRATLLTPLQIELAREAAAVWPGHVGP